MKGIILAGGKATRLYPATLAISKHMLEIYDKPMIYYPLSMLMLAGIRDILIISTPRDVPTYKELLGDGSQLGLKICYKVQEQANGLAEAFILGADFIGKDNVCLILGDNVFYGNKLSEMLQQSVKNIDENGGGAELYGYKVSNPEAFGVAYEKDGQVYKIVEKPVNPESNLAVTGLYFYDNKVVEYAREVKPSARGELEITTINNMYVNAGRCKLNKLGRGFAWLDTGTHENLLQANIFIETVQKRTGYMIACVEEVAYRMHFIDKNKLLEFAEKYSKSDYGKYLKEVYEEQ